MTFEQLFDEDRIYHVPEPFDFADSVTKDELCHKIIKSIGVLYKRQDMTVRDICEVFDFEYKPSLQKLFYKLYGAKGKHHGGARRNLSKLKN